MAGTVNEIAIRKHIGLALTFPELGTNSNHFSTESLEIGERNSRRESEVEPIFLEGLGIGKLGKLEGEWDIS